MTPTYVVVFPDLSHKPHEIFQHNRHKTCKTIGMLMFIHLTASHMIVTWLAPDIRISPCFTQQESSTSNGGLKMFWPFASCNGSPILEGLNRFSSINCEYVVEQLKWCDPPHRPRFPYFSSWKLIEQINFR